LKYLDLLWEYQKADLECEEYERKMKDTPTRKQLIKLQKFLQAGQTRLTELQKASLVKQDRVASIEARSKTFLEDLEELTKDFGYFSEATDEELDEKEITLAVKSTEKIVDSLAESTKQLMQIKAELEQSEKLIRESMQKMRAAKTEYDALMETYQSEIAAGAGELAVFRQKIENASKPIPQELLERYQKIKGFRQDPIALLKDSRCGGCNMQLPSNIEARVRNEEKPVECENCGRILYIMD